MCRRGTEIVGSPLQSSTTIARGEGAGLTIQPLVFHRMKHQKGVEERGGSGPPGLVEKNRESVHVKESPIRLWAPVRGPLSVIQCRTSCCLKTLLNVYLPVTAFPGYCLRLSAGVIFPGSLIPPSGDSSIRSLNNPKAARWPFLLSVLVTWANHPQSCGGPGSLIPSEDLGLPGCGGH